METEIISQYVRLEFRWLHVPIFQSFNDLRSDVEHHFITALKIIRL